MEKKVIKLEDLKEGMKLRSLKRVYYVSRDEIEEGVMLWEELVNCVSCLIEKDCIWEVEMDGDEVYVVYDGESNEGWFDLEEVLEKGVFEII
jgi:hypothetical protein